MKTLSQFINEARPKNNPVYDETEKAWDERKAAWEKKQKEQNKAGIKEC